MDQPALDQRLGTVGANPPCCSRTARSRIDHRYSRKRRPQAASTDIPKIKEAGYANCCFRNRIARKRDTKKVSRRGYKAQFVDVLLHPKIVLEPGSDIEKAKALHEKAHNICVVANSMNFPVRCEAEVIFDG